MKGDPLYSRWLLLWWMRRISSLARYLSWLGVVLYRHTVELTENAIEDYHLQRGHIRKGKFYPDKFAWLNADGTPLTEPTDYI